MADGGRPYGGASPDAPKLPHNIEAEQAILGALLLNNDVADSLGGLDAAHFYDPVHGRVYALAMRLIRDGKVASPVSMRLRLADDAGLAELGGVDYLARLAGAAVSVAAAGAYAEDVTEAARRREVIRIATELQERAGGDFEAGAAEHVSQAVEALHALDEQPGARESGVTLGRAMETAVTAMNAAFQGGEPAGISLGVPALESCIGKALDGDYLLIAGRPSMGKSALAIEMARRCATAGVGVVYWCHEMAPEQNAERMLSAAVREAGRRVPYRDARQGRMSEDDFRAIIEAGRDMDGLPVRFVEPSIRDLRRLAHEIARHVRRFQRQGRPVIFVVDYLQKITTAPGARPYERVSEASGALKALAMRLRCPALVLSQLSRNVENRENRRPTLADLRDSGEIEQDANTAIFLYRDEYYLERDLEGDPEGERANDIRRALDRCRGVLDLIVAKQRSGPIRTVKVGFDGATNSIWELGAVVPFPAREGFEV